MEAKKENENVALKLSINEALVLIEWLSEFNKKDNTWLFEDQAEERVLFDLESSLEQVLSQTFEGNYLDKLLSARREVRDKE
ncbi:MAG: hypothetical protein IPG01_09130 [Chitinophagaceae bacterium]|nr:hypothetical protein [Chitinophagaceae bacterium]